VTYDFLRYINILTYLLTYTATRYGSSRLLQCCYREQEERSRGELRDDDDDDDEQDVTDGNPFRPISHTAQVKISRGFVQQ